MVPSLVIPMLATALYAFGILTMWCEPGVRGTFVLLVVTCSLALPVSTFLTAYYFAPHNFFGDGIGRCKFGCSAVGPALVAFVLASFLFPRVVMPMFVHEGTSDLTRGVIALAAPPVVFSALFLWQRWGVLVLRDMSLSDGNATPSNAGLVLSFVSTFWTRVLVSGNAPMSGASGIRSNTMWNFIVWPTPRASGYAYTLL